MQTTGLTGRMATLAAPLSEVGNNSYVGSASGGIIGLLVGIIGGPVGMLLGGTYGALVGSLFDIDDIATTDSVLGEISNQVQPTRTAVLAHVTEQSPEVIDTAMARLGGQVMRRPVFEVEQEIAAAQEAQRNAEREARSELRKARLEKGKDDAHAKVEELKSKLHRTKAWRGGISRTAMTRSGAGSSRRRTVQVSRSRSDSAQ